MPGSGMRGILRALGGRLFPARTPTKESRGAGPAFGPRRLSLHDISDRFLTIDELGFFGQFSRSPDGRHLVAWSDRGPDAVAGDRRGDGRGRWILLRDGFLVAEGRLQRPGDGKVADDGTVLLSDWLSGDGLDGVLVAISGDGRQLMARGFSANLADTALSTDGAYAVCRTLNSPGSPDSRKLVLFDARRGVEIARWDPEPVPIFGYEFETGAGILHVFAEDGDRATYDFDGTMVNAGDWRAGRIRRGDLAAIKAFIEECRGVPSPAAVEEILDGLDVACAAGPGWLTARAFRLKGEFLEGLARPGDALAAY